MLTDKIVRSLRRLLATRGGGISMFGLLCLRMEKDGECPLQSITLVFRHVRFRVKGSHFGGGGSIPSGLGLPGAANICYPPN